MRSRHFRTCFGLVAAFYAFGRLTASEQELNLWPVVVEHLDEAGRVRSWQGAGPLLFRQPGEEGQVASGLRPLTLAIRDVEGARREFHFLYPLFSFRAETGRRRWSVLQLINWSEVRGDAGGTAETGFDIWPFYFSRDTGSPDTSYRALFPIAGTLRNRLFNERASWVLFPLYARTENAGRVMTALPWPFIRKYSGDGHTGLSIWPLFDRRSREGDYRSAYYLWPLIYDVRTGLGEATPSRSWGFLPFYARESSAEVEAATWLWPLFGYTHRTAPHRYDETRWLWPLFVQGRGDDRERERWAPFYTHSNFLGEEKTWILWPVFRRKTWPDSDIIQTKTQILYFLYWSREQRSASNPDLAPARKTHVWPVASFWNNGAGHRQIQLFSPLEVFFPDNDKVRLAWSPLFAVYRYDRQPNGTVRQSAVFDLLTWRSGAGEREFHLGPLVDVRSGEDGARISLAGGLVGLQRPAGGRWRPFWFDFSPELAESGGQMEASLSP